jgi:hypothetical protein
LRSLPVLATPAMPVRDSPVSEPSAIFVIVDPGPRA